jgi:hypothetical protein
MSQPHRPPRNVTGTALLLVLFTFIIYFYCLFIIYIILFQLVTDIISVKVNGIFCLTIVFIINKRP